MQVTPEEQYHLDKWWILQELKREFLVSEPSEMSTVYYLREQDAPSKLVQSRLLEQLAGQHHIELEKIDDNSFKVTFQHGFVKAYDAMALWFRNFSEVTGIKTIYKSSVEKNLEDVITVRLSKEGRGLWLVANADDKVLLNRFTTGRAPELIMSYLINNRTGSLVRIGELDREIVDLPKVKDIAEVIRKVGFDRNLKKLFFKRCGTKEVELINPVQISKSEWQKLKQKLQP